METLRGVFPAVPTEALLRVLEICDQSVAVASTWLLENEWQDLTDAQDEEEEEGDEHARTSLVAQLPGTNFKKILRVKMRTKLETMMKTKKTCITTRATKENLWWREYHRLPKGSRSPPI
ncbi:hypothetical protein L914_20813 [Phytophthora nicotianae]|uniref:CUE domain-containing protein n=1 Tax=Phytophthora nicotianae TaxID=4792 RepID=W2M5J2_PHYNI|nr:hypothetical protein L914_20813 [Phytophthora nicotianae]